MSEETTQEKEEPAKNTIMAIYAHPDDELSCAGTMANHVDQGDEVHLVFLTKGENITNMKGTEEEIIAKRKAHTDKIEGLLGVQVHFMDFADSRIEYNLEGGYKVARKIREVKPDIIITWNDNNEGTNHPDHTNTGKLVMDAITYARLQDPGTELPPHRKSMNIFVETSISKLRTANQVIIDTSDQHKKVIKFIEIYKEAYGFPHMDFYITHVSRTFGLSRGVKYAEAFEIKGIRSTSKTLPTNPGFANISPDYD